MNDLLATTLWWLTLQLFGLTTLPLAFRLFRWLPDRGYALNKALGVLLVSYLFWLLNSLGFLHNSAGGILFSAAAVAVFSVWAYRRGRTSGDSSITEWLRRHGYLVLAVESLFLLSFVLWAAIRAHNPEITNTEKPMDLAFIQAIGRSDHFPPLDPWLSGFAISYYYFGYLMTAVVARFTGVPGTVAFNLGLAWQFSGTLLGGFALVFNLVTANSRAGAHVGRASRMLHGLLGAVMVGVMGNLEGLLEVLHARAILPAGFWRWLDIEELSVPPGLPTGWPPRGGWWWWRASRVIHDRSLMGASMGLQPIDEFPFFSFLLGDMHPHVLALPYVLLGLGLALNWWLRRWEPDAGSDGSLKDWVGRFVREADPVHLGVYAVCLGALGFLNTWDFPSILLVTVGSLALAQLRDRARCQSPKLESGWVAESLLSCSMLLVVLVMVGGKVVRGEAVGALWIAVLLLAAISARVVRVAWRRHRETGRWRPGLVGQLLLVAAGLALLGVLCFIPFYVGFRSQAAGLLPNVINPTRLPQFVVMFGPLLIIMLLWMATQSAGARAYWKTGAAVAGGLLAALLLAVTLLGAAAAFMPFAQPWIAQTVDEAGGLAAAARLTLVRRVTDPWTALLLLGVIGLAVTVWRVILACEEAHAVRQELPALSRPSAEALTVHRVGEGEPSQGVRGTRNDTDSVAPFVLLLVLTGALLAVAPEFVYLRDVFGARINTVFKFYYLAWVLFAVASGFAFQALLQKAGWIRWAGGLGAGLLIAAGLLYPALSTPTRMANYSGPNTLDGMAYMEETQPADWAAIRWLQENVDGAPVILEAVGGQYTWGGRISVHTGLPTVLGWAGHEHQWRGDTAESGRREPDVRTLYTSRSWSDVQRLLDQYHIEYVVVGPLEVSTYGQVAATKFERVLDIVFQADGVTIYRWQTQTQQ